MWKNYLKMAMRSLWRNKTFSLLNILGLSLGLTSALLLYFLIHFELSVNRFHIKKDRIYRLTEEFKWQNNHIYTGITNGRLAPRLKQDFKEIEAATRVQSVGRRLVSYKEKAQYLESLFYTDSTFFQIFSYDFLVGNPNTCLDKPNSIVLTRDAAEKIFGRVSNVVGKMVKVEDRFQAKVTAITKNSPKNSSFNFQAWISTTSPLPDEVVMDSWQTYGDLFSFLLLKEGEDVKKLEKKAESHIRKIHERENISTENSSAENLIYRLRFQPIGEMHLYSSDILGGGEGNINDVYILISIALFILIIASINYVNLATARAINRAKEVGVRKVLGAHKRQLVSMFMLESTVLVLIAFTLSLIFIELFSPIFFEILDKPIILNYFDNANFIVIILLAVIFLSVMSGLYPAFVLSSFEPALVLKGKFGNNRKSLILRKGLVVFQFTISIIFIICTLLFYTQLMFMKTKNLGLNKTNIIALTIMNPTHNNKKITKLKQTLAKSSGIEWVGMASNHVGRRSLTRSSFRVMGNKNNETIQAQYFSIDQDFYNLFEIELKKGQFFSTQQNADTSEHILINETMAKRLGGTKAALGKELRSSEQSPESYKIIGVVKDFHLNSVKENIKPIVLFFEKHRMPQVYIRLKPGTNPQKCLAKVKKVYEQYDVTYPFRAEFVEQNYDEHYDEQERQTSVFSIFTVLTIFIACIGLFGLALYTIQQRTKEIGVRKVLGASVRNILLVVSKDFLLLISFASLLALPLAFYIMNIWLNDFAYRIDLWEYWYIFLLAVIIAFLIASLTILTQAFKASRVNPVQVLKYE